MTAVAPLRRPETGLLPGPAATPIIDVRAYSFWYGATQALFDVSFTVPRRAVTALIGPSGFGKSTFLRSINRMNELLPGTRHSGDILLEGILARHRSRHAAPPCRDGVPATQPAPQEYLR